VFVLSCIGCRAVFGTPVVFVFDGYQVDYNRKVNVEICKSIKTYASSDWTRRFVLEI
jgi:hypothetical protein